MIVEGVMRGVNYFAGALPRPVCYRVSIVASRSALPRRAEGGIMSEGQDPPVRVLGGSRRKYLRWAHPLTRQTPTASPTEPGELLTD